ncbi:MAG: hypothetical protein JXR29_13010, partial [Methylothermaceae bacterium]|nr:hypothetical protein [Methylothermaceae bacterium]
MRTGDLGFIADGRLRVTGRIKDLIILRGRNFYPQDIEQALTDRLPSLPPGGCAAFPVAGEDEEGVAVVAEVTREVLRKRDFVPILRGMRRVLSEECELSAADLVLVKPGGVPKTSSGKLRRRACREAYLNGGLPVLART